MLKRTSKSFIWVLILIVVLGCDSEAVYDHYKSVPNMWHKDSIISFNINAPDTLKPYNLFVNLRNTNDYKFNNLYLIVDMNYPNGKVIKDTLEYKMAAPNGELLGSGFSDIKENKLWYKGFDNPFVFSEIGSYSIEIQHAMRQLGDVEGVTNLDGVTDIGVRIEYAESNKNIE
ncbi:MAG: gliding motility lipoprotein GldH [Winogradskyella sp.]|nr:gliding motility lipoprotein GldH [Winogradskyella sp.]